MKLLATLALLVVTAITPADASAKGVATLVVVGPDGRSITIQPEEAVLAVMLYHPASVDNRRPEPATPRGGYVKLYPLGARGFPAIPGRFYPAKADESIAATKGHGPRTLRLFRRHFSGPIREAVDGGRGRGRTPSTLNSPVRRWMAGSRARMS
jgi:hypothetical protein